MKLADTNSEFIRYSFLGVPTSFPRGDYDLDGADTAALMQVGGFNGADAGYGVEGCLSFTQVLNNNEVQCVVSY